MSSDWAVDLPPATAAWVLAAHVVTIFAPLAVLGAIAQYWSSLQAISFMPVLFIWSAVVLIMGSLYESCQNAVDHWYLTRAENTVLDCLFNSCIVLSLALTALACQGQHLWLWPLAILAVPLYVWLYWSKLPAQAVQGVMGVAATLCMYLSFRDPVVVLPLLSVFLTLYFYNILLATRAQSMHGYTTIVNALGLMATPWAIYNEAHAARLQWYPVLSFCLFVIVMALVLRPYLLTLKPTARQWNH